MAHPVVYTAKKGNAVVQVRQFPAFFRFRYRDPDRGGKVRFGTFQDLADAKKAARQTADRLDAHARNVVEVPKDEYRLLVENKPAMDGLTLRQAAEQFLGAKKAAHGVTRTTKALCSDLNAVLKGLGMATPITAVSASQVEAWLHSLEVGTRRKANLRAVAVQLFRWCRDRGILPDRKTEPEKAEKIRVEKPEVGVFSPTEVTRVIRVVPTGFLNAVLLGAFAGLRPEEIIPNTGSAKPVVEWGNVVWERSELRVPANVAKTRKARLVPIKPNLLEWLLPQRGSTGRLCKAQSPLSKNETGRLREKHSITWKHDVLRHSYGTYRVAQTRDYYRVSNEMGNSVTVCRSDYDAVASEDTADAWFSITPDTAGMGWNSQRWEAA